MKKTKSFRVRIDHGPEREIGEMPERRSRVWGSGLQLVPSGKDIEGIISEIPEGHVSTFTSLMDELARRHSCAVCCPMVTGILWRVVGEAFEENPATGAPYWRIIKDKGHLNPKLPGGEEAHAQRLKAEGHQLEVRRGRTKWTSGKVFRWRE